MASDAQRIERALQLLEVRLAKSDLFNDGTVKVVPATSNVGKRCPLNACSHRAPLAVFPEALIVHDPCQFLPGRPQTVTLPPKV